MKAKVISFDNKPAGDIELNETVFGAKLRRDILQRVVEWQRARKQAGTHKAKQVGDISGTTKKPWRQKGTGRARAGSLRSPQFRGGAVIFGPVVRSHAYSLPKKIRQLGLRVALSLKQAEGKLVILDEAKLKQPKTGDLKKKLAALGFGSALFIDGKEVDANLAKAASNLYRVDALPQIGANVYDILKHDTLVLTVDAVKQLQERLA